MLVGVAGRIYRYLLRILLTETLLHLPFIVATMLVLSTPPFMDSESSGSGFVNTDPSVLLTCTALSDHESFTKCVYVYQSATTDARVVPNSTPHPLLALGHRNRPNSR